MIENVSLTSQAPNEYSVKITPFYDDEIESLKESLPEVFEMFLRTPSEQAIEVIVIEKTRYYRFIAVRLGKREDCNRQVREEAGGAAWLRVENSIEKDLLIDLRMLDNKGVDFFAGFFLASWRFKKYQCGSKSQKLMPSITVLCRNINSFQPAFLMANAKVLGTIYARELTSEPPNQLPPLQYAQKLGELSKWGVEVTILEQKQLESIGMSGLLAVSKGSDKPPAVAILRWNGNLQEELKPPVALVGKGVCFDSGGLCLKPASQQIEMKWDKAGGGVVAGVIKALALANAPVNVIGVIGLVENMPDGKAMKPGDVIKTMSGVSVEIVNTDAEGRLVLADCLWYAQKEFNCSHIVDLGTLTMETFASLGTAYAAIYSNDSFLCKELIDSGKASGELLWKLPMGDYFAKQISSDVADIKNLGIESLGENGAAAEFLCCFIGKGVSWAHLDIAGVSWTKEDLPICSKGVTGFGVRLLFEWLVKDRFLLK